MKVKALSLWQPWASLWAAGVKPYETRDWATKYRGPLLIHAAKADVRAFTKLVGVRHANILRRACFEAGLPTVEDLPRGSIVGGGEMYHAAKVLSVSEDGVAGPSVIHARFAGQERVSVHTAEAHEMVLGDVRAGRWLWFIRHHDMLVTPVPWRGRQSLFDVEVPETEEWRTLRCLITELWGGEFDE